MLTAAEVRDYRRGRPYGVRSRLHPNDADYRAGLKRVYDRWIEARNMTLCIGALADQPMPLEHCIVLCFDYMVSVGDAYASETEYKFRRLSDELICMFAGSPSVAKEVALLYEGHLKRTDLSEENLVEQLQIPLDRLKARQANSFIQRRLCISYRDLLDKGERWLGKERWEWYLNAIDAHSPRVELIIAGYVRESPVLCVARRYGNGLLLEHCTNFCMIGCGSDRADPVLHSRAQTFNTLLPQALYNVYEPKRAGEASPPVGTKTRMYVLRPPLDGEKQIRCDLVDKPGEKWLRGLYRKFGPKPMRRCPNMPQDALVPAMLKWPLG